MIYLTVDKIMAWKPCPYWPRERVASVFGKRKRLPLLDLLHMSDISEADRVWLGCHALSARDARLVACLWATGLLKAARAAEREPAEASWNAVRIARRFANGRATAEELEKAAVAAESAESAAASWSHEAWAAMAARMVARMEVVEVAAAAAFWVAEGLMERKQQLRDIIRVVQRLEKGGGV